jgi:hypothetical protein
MHCLAHFVHFDPIYKDLEETLSPAIEKLHKAGQLLRVFKSLESINQDVVSSSGPEGDMEMLHNRDYRNEGRKTFYTDTAMSRRHNLRHHNDVTKALEKFFVAISRGSDNTLNRQEVMDVQVQSIDSILQSINSTS